eukprot:15471640-Alexandrium_andersonii.AAC.1
MQVGGQTARGHHENAPAAHVRIAQRRPSPALQAGLHASLVPEARCDLDGSSARPTLSTRHQCPSCASRRRWPPAAG